MKPIEEYWESTKKYLTSSLQSLRRKRWGLIILDVFMIFLGAFCFVMFLAAGIESGDPGSIMFGLFMGSFMFCVLVLPVSIATRTILHNNLRALESVFVEGMGEEVKNLYKNMVLPKDVGRKNLLFPEPQIYQTGVEMRMQIEQEEPQFGFLNISNPKKRKIKYFQGFFFWNEYGQKFPASAVILPDPDRLFGIADRWEKWQLFPDATRFRTDYPDFERSYSVYTDDIEKCKDLFGHDFIVNLVKARDMHQLEVYVSFNKKTMCIGVSAERSIYHAPLFKTLPSLDHFERLLYSIYLAWDLFHLFGSTKSEK